MLNAMYKVATLCGTLMLAHASAAGGQSTDPGATPGASRDAPIPWLVALGTARLETGARETLEGGRVTLSDGRTFRLNDARTADLGARRTRVVARVADEAGSSFILSRVGDAWHGLMMTDDGWHELRGQGRSAGGLVLDAFRVDPASVPRCGVGHAPAAPAQDALDQGRRDDRTGPREITEYTLLACYTSQSRLAAGGADEIVARVLTAVELTNLSYERSEIDVRIRLVGTLEVPAKEDELGDFGANLTFLTAGGNGFYPQAHPARDLLGADLMTLLIDRDELCGIAWLFTGSQYHGVSVCAWHCVGNTGTLAHEIGHNFGCAHDRPNANGSTAPYGYGHRFNGDSGTLYRTIMAYRPGARIARFSNPDVLFEGVPTGVPVGQAGEAHNALLISQNATAIAAFRTDEAPDANGNFIDDRSDIASGTSKDANGDGVPDEAQSPVLRVAMPHDLARWPDAITDPALAFAAAASDAAVVTEVRFASGRFAVHGIAGEPLLVQDGVTYLGGYDTATDERDPLGAPTVLSGDLFSNDDPSDPSTLEENTARLGEGFDLSPGTVLDGFEFRDARAFGDDPFGAGFLFRGGGEVLFRNCAFRDLTAEFGSPAVHAERGALVRFESCVIADNRSDNGAGGIGAGDGGRFEAADTAFERNASGFWGGAVSIFAGGPSAFDRCRFAGNTATRGGGALRAAGGGLRVTESVFEDNEAASGGAVHIMANATPVFRFDDCRFTGNRSDTGGAISTQGGTRLDIARSRLAGNSATGTGGAVALLDFTPDVGSPSLRLHASTVIGNRSGGDGGAIGSDRPGTSVHVVSSVIASNDAGGTGGGISLAPGSLPAFDGALLIDNDASVAGGLSAPDAQFAQFTNSVFWGNTDDASGTRDAQIAVPSIGFAIIGHNTVQDDAPADGDAWPGTGNLDLAPRLMRPGTAGPDGAWGTPDDEAGDWRASPGSPLIDAGTALLMMPDVLDLDGDGDLNEPHPFGVDGRARITGAAPDIGPAEAVQTCNAADLAEPFGLLDPADIALYVGAFTQGDTLADLSGDGVVDLADIVAFITAFTAGCP